MEIHLGLGRMQQQGRGSPQTRSGSTESDWPMYGDVQFQDGRWQQRGSAVPLSSSMFMESDGIVAQAPGLNQTQPGCASLQADWPVARPRQFQDGRMQQHRPGSPEPSCVSLKSDWSMDRPIQFQDGRRQQQRPGSPQPSCVSLKSDWSMDRPIQFRDGRMQQQRPGSPQASGVSLKSDWSMDRPIQFQDGRMQQHRPGSPQPSCVSLKSDWSMDRPIQFQDGGWQQQRSALPPPSFMFMESDGTVVRPPGLNQMQQHRPGSPEPSCVSLKSDWSMDRPIQFQDGRVQQQRSGAPEPSFISMKSDWSMDRPIQFQDARWQQQRSALPPPSFMFMESDWTIDRPPGLNQMRRRSSSPRRSGVSMKSDWSMDPSTQFQDERVQRQTPDVPRGRSGHPRGRSGHPRGRSGRLGGPSGHPTGPSGQQYLEWLKPIFLQLEQNLMLNMRKELNRIQSIVVSNCPEYIWNQTEDEEVLDGEEEEQRRSGREAFLKMTLHNLRKMKQEDLADHLLSKTFAPKCQHDLKCNLQKKCQCVFEGIAKAGNPTLLKEIYTELYITEGGTTEVNDEHEVRQIESTSRKPARPEITIKQEDIFKNLPGRNEPIRTVMTKGVAGIGKTVLTQKFTLDWAEDQANQEVQFMFPFTFRELNVLKEKKFSLVELVHHFFSETKEAGICRFDKFEVLFIFDGLDECRLPLDFHNNPVLTDVTESTSVDVLLTNLIGGNLLPSARLWITTRPAAASQIPPECVGLVTEVRGFNDEQKEEYFKKRFRDQEQAGSIISHIKKSRSLHIMCHIPVFCWITATVLEDVLKTGEGGALPKTLTEMYIHFLVVQAKLKNVKYDGGTETDPHWNPESKRMIVSLGKLAFEHLQKGNLIFYESDLVKCGIDVTAASVCSGVFTQIFKEERGLYQDTVFCFVHLSIQEFLAALHVHLTFIKNGVNLLEEEQTSQDCEAKKQTSAGRPFYQTAVDKALQSPNGHLDLFLRFLMGLSLQTNQALLQGLLTTTGRTLQTDQKTVQHIKKKIEENPSPEKSINLFHCLNEMNDRSLVEEIQQHLESGRLSTDKLSPAQWSALVFILLSSEDLDVFDLSKYSASEEALLRLLPVVKASNKTLLNVCNLTIRGYEALSSVLSCQSSRLKQLDMSNNNLLDSGVTLLCAGLKSPRCHLESLRLNFCNLTERSCAALSKVLSSRCCSLKRLDLSNNNLHDSGVMQLSDGLGSLHCQLESLGLSGCLITKDGCAALTSALNSNRAYLRELDLSYNYPGVSGKKMLGGGLKARRWKLETLRLDHAGLETLKPALSKYACRLQLDTNTTNRKLKLSNGNRKVTQETAKQPYPDHADRFEWWSQVLCDSHLGGRCYWELQWEGYVEVGVAYKGIKRRGNGDDSRLGRNAQSWCLSCCEGGGFSVWHNGKETVLPSSAVSSRVAVYLDRPAGTLSFYRVSSTLVHLHTFNAAFTQPLYAGLGLRPKFRVEHGSSVFLCSV